MMRFISGVSLVLLVLLSCSSALAGPRYARIIVGTREIVLSPRPIVEEGSVYAPADVLKSLGIGFTAGKRKVGVMIGSDTTELDLHDRNGCQMLKMDNVAKLLDLDRTWNEQTSTLNLLAKLVSVECEDGTVVARTSAPVRVSGTRLWKGRNIISIDLAGAKLTTSARTFPVGSPDIARLRVGQFNDTTARIAIDLTGARSYKLLTTGPSREIRIAVGSGRAKIAAPPAPDKPKPALIEPSVAPVTAKPAEPEAVTITGIKPEPDGDARLAIRVTTSGKASFTTSMLQSPRRFVVDIKNAKLDITDTSIQVGHPLLKEVTTQAKDGTVRLVLESPGYPSFFVSPEGNDLLLNLRRPTGAGGRLSDKTVVIDPGHGGSQPGARGGGVFEKDVNLALAKNVRDTLETAGVRVVMTREGDTYLGLTDRPAVADRMGADLFISIHCNALYPEARSGTEVYYHNGQESGRALAMAIHDCLIRDTGMKDNGVKRDTVLYRSGLAVLRSARVPAILIESGYIDCTSDRTKLCDEEYQKKFAEGILDGLRLYVEGTTISKGQ